MWLDRLREMKEKSGLTTKEIAEKSKISIGTLNKIFAGQTEDPKLGTIQQLVHFFGYTLDDLDDEPSLLMEMGSKEKLSSSEQSHIKKYRALDEHGKEAVDNILDVEYRRCSVNYPSPTKSPNKMSRAELHAELDRQLDLEKEAAADA